MNYRTLLGAGVCAAALTSTPALALQIYVDQDASYQYVNATAATTIGSVPSDWFGYNFDDSGWFTGQAPFSDRPTNQTILEAGNANAPFAPGATQPTPSTYTQWDVNLDPYVRTEFFLPVQTALTVWIAVDNGINSMYLNGVLSTGATNAEGNAFRWEHVFDIAADYTVAGRNVLALQLEDHGGATGFVMMVTANDAANNPTFTTNAPNPALVPLPGVLALMGVGFAGLGATRRRL